MTTTDKNGNLAIAVWRWIQCLVRHSWDYTPAEYYDEELALEKRRAMRTCKRCSKSEIRSRHCLGLNPPEYHDDWNLQQNGKDQS